MKLRALAPLTIALALICATSANAKSPETVSVRAAALSQGLADAGLAFNQGRAYWWEDGFRNVRLFQSAPGMPKRTIHKVRRGSYAAIYAGSGYVAFGVTELRRLPQVNGRDGLIENQIWVMEKDAAAPQLVSSETERFFIKRTVKYVKGRKRTTTLLDTCGDSNELFAMSDQAQVVFNVDHESCTGKGFKSQGVIQDLTAGSQIRIGDLSDQIIVQLRQGKLLRTPDDALKVTDLSNGKTAKYGEFDFVDQVAMGPNGEIGLVTLEFGKRLYSRVHFYPAGSNKPVAHYNVNWLDLVSLTACAGGFIDIREKKTKMVMTLRGLDGKPVKTIIGPSEGLDYETECVGRTLTLVAQKNHKAPQFFTYEF